MRRLFVGLGLMLLSMSAWAALRETTVTIGKAGFTSEVAEDDRSRELGLMFRPYLAADHAMLFVWPDDRVLQMWMRNTFIPLDMLFLSADGKIAAIHERAVPRSDDIISSGVPVRAVLEVNSGTAAKLRIHVGDRVTSPALNPAASAAH